MLVTIGAKEIKKREGTMVALPPYKQALKLFFSLISLSLVVCLLYFDDVDVDTNWVSAT